MEKLKFSPMKGNAKLDYMGKGAYTISLLSGWSCPGSKDCLSKVLRIDGRSILEDGKDIKFRCFSASQEAMYSNVYKNREYNFNLLKRKSEDDMFELISLSLPLDSKIIRMHVAGDFFNEKYFRAWIRIAKEYPKTIFYAYTKSIKFWISNLDAIPKNMKLTASRGGKWDCLIDKYKLKCAEVVFSEEEAEAKGLQIDHDDKLAYQGNKSFALLIHGNQPKDSPALNAWKKVKETFGGYSKKKNQELKALTI